MFFLAVAALVLGIALGLVVILGHPTNASHLLAWGLIADGGALALIAVLKA